MIARVSLASFFPLALQPAVNSFSRVARSRSSALVAACIRSGISQLLSRPFSRAASAASAISCSPFPPAARYRSQPDRRIYLLLPNRWLNWLVRVAASVFSTFNLLLSACSSLAPAKDKTLMNHPTRQDGFHYRPPGIHGVARQASTRANNSPFR